LAFLSYAGLESYALRNLARMEWDLQNSLTNSSKPLEVILFTCEVTKMYTYVADMAEERLQQ
jgi:hypothetical protein